jgi:putative membrane protein insertion efficiency factor
MRTTVSRTLWVAGAPVRALLTGAILLYRRLFAGMFAGRCRFHPSCSAYALESIRTHGAAKGFVLATWRVARCSPLSAGGPDPVPDRGSWRPTAAVR